MRQSTAKVLISLANSRFRLWLVLSNAFNKSIRGGEPICYHGLHKLWIITGGPQITFDLILEFHLGDGGFLCGIGYYAPAYHGDSF